MSVSVTNATGEQALVQFTSRGQAIDPVSTIMKACSDCSQVDVSTDPAGIISLPDPEDVALVCEGSGTTETLRVRQGQANLKIQFLFADDPFDTEDEVVVQDGASVCLYETSVGLTVLQSGFGDAKDMEETEDAEDADAPALAGSADTALALCLEAAGLEVAEPGAADLPIRDVEGGGPAIVSGVAGVGVRAGGAAAVVFVYDTAEEAVEAAAVLGGDPAGDRTLIFEDPGFPAEAARAVIECAEG